MRRVRVITAMAACVALTVGGCGVQSTGVSIAPGGPFTATPSTSPQSAPPPQEPYSAYLYLYPINRGAGTMVQRPVATPPTAMDLVNMLASLTSDEVNDQYQTYVTPDIRLQATGTQGHEYIVISNAGPKLNSLVLTQLNCTLDQYWRLNPDTNPTIGPATRLIVPGSPYPPSWNDCPDGVIAVGPTTAPDPLKPTFPGAAKPGTGR